MSFQNLPTLAEIQAKRHAKPKGAEPSRRQVNDARAKDDTREETRWHKEIAKRDGNECRWCHRKVVDCLERVANRREHHHVSGRVVKAIRWDKRNGLQLCGACHDRVTGKVAEKFLIYSRHTFSVDGVAYINADKPVRYQRTV